MIIITVGSRKHTHGTQRHLTSDEGVFDAEAEAFQLFVTGELDPHETSRWRNQAWILSTTEAVNKRGEPKGSITDLDVIEAALKGGLDVVILVKRQLNPLSGEGFGGKSAVEQRESKRLKPWKGQNHVTKEKSERLSNWVEMKIWVNLGFKVQDAALSADDVNQSFSLGC